MKIPNWLEWKQRKLMAKNYALFWKMHEIEMNSEYIYEDVMKYKLELSNFFAPENFLFGIKLKFKK